MAAASMPKQVMVGCNVAVSLCRVDVACQVRS